MRLVNDQLEFQKKLRFQDVSMHQISPLIRSERIPYIVSDVLTDCPYILHTFVPIFDLLLFNYLLTSRLRTKSWTVGLLCMTTKFALIHDSIRQKIISDVTHYPRQINPSFGYGDYPEDKIMGFIEESNEAIYSIYNIPYLLGRGCFNELQIPNRTYLKYANSWFPQPN